MIRPVGPSTQGRAREIANRITDNMLNQFKRALTGNDFKASLIIRGGEVRGYEAKLKEGRASHVRSLRIDDSMSNMFSVAKISLELSNGQRCTVEV
ncbi:MAG: hypothetical protein ABIA67_06805, partial [Candidatus Margulisiibacteriota bacterium]